MVEGGGKAATESLVNHDFSRRGDAERPLLSSWKYLRKTLAWFAYWCFSSDMPSLNANFQMVSNHKQKQTFGDAVRQFFFLSLKTFSFFPLCLSNQDTFTQKVHYYFVATVALLFTAQYDIYWVFQDVLICSNHASNPIFSNNFSNPRKLWNHEFVWTPCILSKQERSISVFHMPSSHLWRDEGSNSIIHGYLLSFLSSHSTSFFFWVLVVNKRAEHEQGYLAKFAQFLVFILST